MFPHSNNHAYYYAIEEPNISSFTINDPLPPPAAAAAAERLLPCRRKYRRSKICTAQGLRDRRMRLSLDVAGEFFDLQDLLGFDKASKTVQWLLTKSKYAIRELAIPAAREARTTSGCRFEDEEEDIVAGGVFAGKAEQRSSIEVKSLRTRESRKVARERARLRTLEKKKMKINECCCGGQDGDDASAALLFDYDYQTVDCLFDQEPWEMDFRVSFDEGVLLDS